MWGVIPHFIRGRSMMLRTIEELHDKEIGHRKFAKVVDLLIEEGYEITDIKEGYEKFNFLIDKKFPYSYSKDWKASAKDYVDYVKKLIDMETKLTYIMSER